MQIRLKSMPVFAYDIRTKMLAFTLTNAD
jgi:hypothetical protein